MAHQYMPKIFHGPHKNPPTPPSYILNVRSLNATGSNKLMSNFCCENFSFKQIMENDILALKWP